MSKKATSLKVLLVDDNRDGADALGLLVEALGHQVHVTYGGSQALDVATAFQADLMLVDLGMPEIDGFDLVRRFRLMPHVAHTKIVAVTGHADQEHRALAMKAGFDKVLTKPVVLNEIKAVLADVVATQQLLSQSDPQDLPRRGHERRLPMGEARRIRNERASRTLTQDESEAAISDGILRFQEGYLGWKSEQVHVHFINELVVVRIRGTLTLAERHLGKSSSAENGRDLIKRGRKQLLELARPMLESLVHEVTGVKVLSMHHDISTVTGEEIILFSLANSPRLEPSSLACHSDGARVRRAAR